MVRFRTTIRVALIYRERTTELRRTNEKYGQTIDNGNIANQIHGFTIDYGKFILLVYMNKIDLPIPPILLICVIVSKRWIE